MNGAAGDELVHQVETPGAMICWRRCENRDTELDARRQLTVEQVGRPGPESMTPNTGVQRHGSDAAAGRGLEGRVRHVGGVLDLDARACR